MAVSIENPSSAGRSSWPAFAALLAGALAMAVSPVFVRLSDVGPFASAFLRVLLALPILYAWMRLERASRPIARPAWRFSAAVVAMGVTFSGDLLLWHLAILNTSIANSTFFATTAPVWVGLIGWIALGRRVAPMTIAGLGFCIVGGAALVWESLAIAPGHLLGDFYAALTAVFFGLYFLVVEQARRTEGAATVTFQMSVITAVLLGIAAVCAHLFYGQRLLPSDATGWLVLLCLATICHAGGQGLLSYALGLLPSLFSSLVIFLESFAAAGIAWLVLGEALSPQQGLGGLIILFGIWLARPRPEGAPGKP